MTRVDGNYLRRARNAAALTQLEAAERLGVSDGTVKRWENCENGQKPSSSDVARMEVIYGVPGLWYLWMWWNDDSFRDFFPPLPEITTNGLATAVNIRQQIADVMARQDAEERDLLDGRIDDPQAHNSYMKDVDELLAAAILMKISHVKNSPA